MNDIEGVCEFGDEVEPTIIRSTNLKNKWRNDFHLPDSFELKMLEFLQNDYKFYT